MELKTQTELDVGGDSYNDLLFCAECEAAYVYVGLQLRYKWSSNVSSVLLSPRDPATNLPFSWNTSM